MKIETKQGAYKEHKCAICGKTIKIGDLYALRVIQTSENEIEKLPCCLKCHGHNAFILWKKVYKNVYTNYCKKKCDYDELLQAVEYGLIKADDSRIFFCKERIKEWEFILGYGKPSLYDYSELQESEKELLLKKVLKK